MASRSLTKCRPAQGRPAQGVGTGRTGRLARRWASLPARSGLCLGLGLSSRVRLWLMVGLYLMVGRVEVARANGYGEAKALIVEAEKLLRSGDEAGGLAKLKEAMRLQGGPGKGGYGYARYIHLRLAQHYWAKGSKSKAEAEVKRALKVTSNQRWVDSAYLVTFNHPFIVNHFPKYGSLAGRTRRYPDHRIIPSAVYLHNGPGEHLYAVGSRGLYRLHRRTGRLTTIHEVAGGSLYRFDLAGDDNRMILGYERDKNLYLVTVKPYSERRIPRRMGMHRLYLDRTGKSVVGYGFLGRYGLMVRSTALAPPHAVKRLLKIHGALITGSGNHVVYALWSTTGPYARRFVPHYSPLYHVVKERDLATGRESVLHTFTPVDFRNRLYAFRSETGQKALVEVVDYLRGKRSLLVVDTRTGRFRAYKARFSSFRSLRRTAGAFSFKEDYVVMAHEAAGKLSVARLDLATGKWAAVGEVRTKGRPVKLYAMGVLKDNATIWIHQGDELDFVGASGALKRNDLRRHARTRRPEWAGPTYYTADPEHFYMGIEKGSGRYFMRVALPRLKRP